MKLSVIVPVYNEEKSIKLVYERIFEVLKTLSLDWEIIFIDNKSTDSSLSEIENLTLFDDRVKAISFSRNFGPSVEASISAGYQNCNGDAAIVVYSDLQDPPEFIPEFVDKWLSGFHVVHGVQRSRKGDPIWRNFLVANFYKIMTLLSDTPYYANSGDFKLISRQVIDVLNGLPERARFSRGLIPWIGFSETTVLYDRQPRRSGKSKANINAISYTALTGITSFSLKPLRILSFIGASITVISIIGILLLIAQSMLGNTVPGLTSIFILIFLSIGLNMGAFGLIGEYIGRIQLEVKERPLFVVEKKINFK